MRRANGTGTVTKRKGNLRKPWLARITVGWKDGKQLYKTLGFYETKADAENAIAADRLSPVSEDANITLADLFERWKTTRAYTEITKSTQQSYDAAYLYMSDFAKRKFRDLRPEHFQRMVDKADVLGRSRSTMTKIQTLSGMLCRYAMTHDIVNKDYSDGVRIPKEKKKEIQVFSEADIKKLFENDGVPIIDTILILIYTGMRIRELLKMEKANVDIENLLFVGGSKTDSGRDRIIPIHPKIEKYVRARYEASEKYLIEYEKETGNKKRGTKRTIKTPYLYEYYCDLYYAALDKIGVQRLTPHKTRHTFATMLSAKVKDRKAAAMLIGHSDPNFTDKVYVHPDIERLRKTIETI